MIKDVDASFDGGELMDLRQKLGPRMYERAVDDIGKNATLVADAAAKGATPRVTGHAQRSTAADTNRWEVVGRYPYLDWLDRGEDERGRKMQTRPGGYRIRDEASKAVKEAMPKLIDKATDMIADEWAK